MTTSHKGQTLLFEMNVVWFMQCRLGTEPPSYINI